MRGALFPARAATVALGVLGAILGVTGFSGMAAYNVSRRMQELGLRLALGARTGMSAAVLAMALLGLAVSILPALGALAVDPSRLLREE